MDANGIPNGSLTWQFVQSRAEGSLVYPGATRLRNIAWNTNQAGSPGATFGGIFVTDASTAGIYGWYATWLDAHAWALYRDNPIGGASTWRSSKNYARNHREVFTVAIDNPNTLSGVIGQAIPTNATVYEATYSIFPPGSVTH